VALNQVTRVAGKAAVLSAFAAALPIVLALFSFSVSMAQQATNATDNGIIYHWMATHTLAMLNAFLISVGVGTGAKATIKFFTVKQQLNGGSNGS